MNILLIGDIVGNPGREAIKAFLPNLVEKNNIDFIVANAENSAGGSGIIPKVAQELFSYGINVLTSGDHVWKRKEIFEIIDTENRLLRPLNYPKPALGRGFTIIENKKGIKIAVINLLGRVFLDPMDCPFKATESVLSEIKKETNIILIDFHAEATSEKLALFYYLDGLVSCIAGTHTHIQTADERISEKGTAYITDLGMTGPFDSVLGRKKEQVIERLISRLPVKLDVAEGDLQLQGIIVSVEPSNGKATSIRRIVEKVLPA